MIPLKKCSNRKICSSDYCSTRNGKQRSTYSGDGKNADISKLIKYIDDNVIGRNTTFLGPFGRRKVVYCDYTSSGRALHFIEEYILKEVLPLYGSSLTSTNVTALQSTLYRKEAHDIIRSAVHASDKDEVIFVGNGCTETLRNLIQILDLREPPVIFVGSSEHNLVLLPWREKCAKVIRIAETKEGFLDLTDLENKLQRERQLLNSIGARAQFIGCFSAASNITGILADDIATTVLLHQYDAFSFWDYSCAAPYIPLDMNPLLPGNHKGVHKDAIYFSGHKFVGGVQSCGVIIAKKHLLIKVDECELNDNSSIHLASQSHSSHLQETVKQESGSGAVVSSVRIGLAMHLKLTVGAPNILNREQRITKTVLSFIRTIPEISLLGYESSTVKRLPIFSFLVRHPRGAFLHHNFVCAVLNDVFGIQARGGHVCAGPYTFDLLGIDEKLAESYEEILSKNRKSQCDDRVYLRSTFEVLRPGFTRISLPYFTSDSDVNYILEAVKMVATEGWKLLPQYELQPETADWKHRTNIVFRERKRINAVRFLDGKMTTNERKISGQGPFPQDPADCLQTARNIFNKARKMVHRYPLSDQRLLFNDKSDKLRWFMLPSEAQDLLMGTCKKVKNIVPFSPSKYGGTRNNSLGSESPSESVTVFSKSFPPLLDVSSFQGRHNSLTSFETGYLKRSDSPLGERPCSDYGYLSSLHSGLHRVRCYSLESSSASPRFLSYAENGQCSCGSQTDISDPESSKDSHTLADFSDFGDMGITNLFPATENENIQAYVKGVTEELATEIKTEIREVIATVDNVLSESLENLDANSIYFDKKFNNDFHRTNSTPLLSHTSQSGCYPQQLSVSHKLSASPSNSSSRSRLSSYNSNQNVSVGPDNQRTDVSDHVAVYLAELTSEMVTEMKSELREMVHAVDEIISPSTVCERSSTSSTDTVVKEKTASVSATGNCNKCEDILSLNESSSGEIEDLVVKKNLEKTVEKEYKNMLSKSDSSSDSGVAELKSTDELPETAKRKISVVSREARSSPNIKEEIIESQLNVEFKVDPVSNSLDRRKRSFENINLQPKWHCSPKPVWKATVEAVKEYDMIREGDRILVCLSGGIDSLSLLHTLHQYQYYSQSYGITFTFGAITIDSKDSANDYRPLIPYLHALGVQYLFVEQNAKENESKMVPTLGDFFGGLNLNILFKAAKEHNYNVLAMGHHFDDVAEHFVMTVFHRGKLQSMKAHCFFSEFDVRIIRPYIYVREKHLRHFSESRKLPTIEENYASNPEMIKERHRTRQLLAQQEILQPKLFGNIKSALHSLISGSDVNGAYCEKKKNCDENDPSVFVISGAEEENP